MPQKSLLTKSPPYAVEGTIKALGRNLRTARVRRNMKISEAAERIGAGVRVVSDAEHGKATTSIAVYFALLWLYDMLPDSYGIGDPDTDSEGKRLAMLREPKRASNRRTLDNDF
jgi:transcriptional regulator with XRE-family HTH domain